MISLIAVSGRSVSKSGKYRVVNKDGRFYPQVEISCFFFWKTWVAVENWGKSEMDCFFSDLDEALECIERHKKFVNEDPKQVIIDVS